MVLRSFDDESRVRAAFNATDRIDHIVDQVGPGETGNLGKGCWQCGEPIDTRRAIMASFVILSLIYGPSLATLVCWLASSTKAARTNRPQSIRVLNHNSGRMGRLLELPSRNRCLVLDPKRSPITRPRPPS